MKFADSATSAVEDQQVQRGADTDTRHNLRSDRARIQIKGNYFTNGPENSLWFENLDSGESIDYDAELPLVDEVFDPAPAVVSLPTPVKLSVMPISDATKAALRDMPLKTRMQTDSLPDTVYIKTHKRREREERHFQNFERDKVMYEKLRIERQLDRLRGHDWIKAVVCMTPVRDMRSGPELETKRSRLIDELESILGKFQSWREREKKLKEPDEDPLIAIRRRLEERKHILNGTASEPSEPDDADSNPSPKRAQGHRSSPVSTRKLGIQSKLFNGLRKSTTVGSKRSVPLAFGYPLPQISSKQFHIPQDWILNRDKFTQPDPTIENN